MTLYWNFLMMNKIKTKIMKKIFLFLVTTVLLFGCSKSETEINIETAQYYVKYEASTNSKYIGNIFSVSVNTDKGIQTFTGGHTFEQTFGPFKKGFVATIEGKDSSPGGVSTVIVNISVARGQEPFALKATNSGSGTVSATYTIDY